MKDKEKQIEIKRGGIMADMLNKELQELQCSEMARLIKLPIENWLEDTGAIPQATTYYAELMGCINDSAEVLFNGNYRKLPEDSVVLSMEEYEKLKHYEWRVTSGVCMTQKEWFDFCNEDSNRRTCLRIEEREKVSKETAEKFKTSAIKVINQYRNCDLIDAERLVFELNNIAKQLGVEIKE